MTTRLDAAMLAKAAVHSQPPLSPDPLRQPLFDIHPRAYALLGGAGLWFMGMMTLAFGRGSTMPIVLVICAVTVIGYGLVPLLFARAWPGGTRTANWGSFLARGVATGSGHLTGGAALAQMLVLPWLLAGWATFILILKIAL